MGPAEGSGNSHSEDEDTYADLPEGEASTQEPEDDSLVPLNGSMTQNASLSKNVSSSPPWGGASNKDGMVLFPLPALEDKMMLFIIIAVGVLLIVIITVISLIVCRNRAARSGVNTKFDPFQNPIYEKPVVRVSIPNAEVDPCQEKLDLGDLSDSTAIDWGIFFFSLACLVASKKAKLQSCVYKEIQIRKNFIFRSSFTEINFPLN